MAYDLKNVVYLGTQHELTNADYNTGSEFGLITMDLSAYVDPIARKGRSATGLAIYDVQMTWSNNNIGNPGSPVQTGNMRACVSARQFGVTGDGLTGPGANMVAGDMNASSPLTISIEDYYGAGSAGVSPSYGFQSVHPSKEVPYVVVRDTLYVAFANSVALSADIEWSMRLECAQVTLDQSTLNQLLRTQSQ